MSCELFKNKSGLSVGFVYTAKSIFDWLGASQTRDFLKQVDKHDIRNDISFFKRSYRSMPGLSDKFGTP